MLRSFSLICFLIISSKSYATCTELIQNHKYLLKGGIEYCLESEFRFVLLQYSEQGTEFIEVSNKEKTAYELIYPGEQLMVPDQFKINSFSDLYLSYIDGFVYLESTPIVRKKRSLKNFGQSIAGAGAIGTNLAGGEPNYIPTIVGTAIGTGVGLTTGPLSPVVSPFVGNYITANIIENKGKPRPPLTKINTNRGLSSSGMRAYSGARGGSCYAGCHS